MTQKELVEAIDRIYKDYKPHTEYVIYGGAK